MKSKSAEKLPLRWYDPIFLKIVPPLVSLLIKLLMISCRVVQVKGRERAEKAGAKANGGAIYATWHQRMSYFFYYLGSLHVTVMISQSRDGEYAASLAKCLGFRNVRGSSTKGSLKALKELIKRMREFETGGMLPDGPRGPARVAKIGSVALARDTGVPLVPILWGAEHCWVFNSWDRYMVPRPFSRLVIYYAEPIWVPRSTLKKDLETYRNLLEERLNNGTRWCDEFFGTERPWRKVGASEKK